MAYAATAGGLPFTAVPGVLALQRALVWLAGASVAIVFIEPSPYELVTILAVVAFFATGLRLRLLFMTPLLLLALINIGYSISAIPMFDNSIIASWIATSWYMALTVIFLAMVVSEDTMARLDMLRRGLVVGAMIASLAAIAGYFNLVPGGYDLLTLYGRGRGTFKDPNVLGAFLILPSLLVLQNVVTARFGKALRSTIALGVMTLAILLAFSRAAWGQLILTAAFMLTLMIMTSRSNTERSRIVVTTIVAALAAALLVAVLLSFNSVADMFQQRASFDQSYDEGRFGRFGRHILGADMALDLPFGIGPLQFHRYLPRGHPQFLPQRLHVGRLALRRLLSRPGLPHGDPRLSPHLHPRALAANLSGGVRRLPRHRRRELHHRHRPLAAFLHDAGRDVGSVRRGTALQRGLGARRHRRGRAGFLAPPSLGASISPFSFSVASSTAL